MGLDLYLNLDNLFHENWSVDFDLHLNFDDLLYRNLYYLLNDNFNLLLNDGLDKHLLLNLDLLNDNIVNCFLNLDLHYLLNNNWNFDCLLNNHLFLD